MNLDDLKSDWQNQEVPKMTSELQQAKLLQELQTFDDHLASQNRKLRFALGGTILGVIAILYFFPMFGWPFYLATTGIIFLLLLSLWLFRKRQILAEQQDISQVSSSFLTARIAQLEYNKKITRLYLPIYAIVLTGLILLYTSEVGKLMDRNILFTIYAITLTYIAGIMYYGMRKQLKKDRNTIDPMLEELRRMQQDWTS